MSHKGNFNVTDMGRIALSLQELVERQADEITKLKEDLAGANRMLGIQTRIRHQHEAKIKGLKEAHEFYVDIANTRAKYIDELNEELKIKKLSWPGFFWKMLKGK